MATAKKSRPRITSASSLSKCKPDPNGQYYAGDAKAPGLYLKVHPSGKKSWMFRYKAGGKQRWLKLGEYVNEGAGMSLSEAREQVAEHRKLAREVVDIKAHRDAEQRKKLDALKQEKAQRAASAFTVRAMVREYFNTGAGAELKSARNIGQTLDNHILPTIGDMPAADVRKSDIKRAIQGLKDAGQVHSHNRAKAYIRAVYAWALDDEDEDQKRRVKRFPGDFQNPAIGIKSLKEHAKERALGDVEIRRFVEKLPEIDTSRDVRDALMLILLTGMRPGEVCGASYTGFDGEARTLTTMARTKNGSYFTVQLNDWAFEIIQSRRGDSGLIFPGRRTDNSLSPRGVARRLRDRILPEIKTLPFTPHDLRRTYATGLARLGAPRTVISLSLNHTVPGITSSYVRHGYESELREWSQRWGDHVAALVGKGKCGCRVCVGDESKQVA